MNAAMPAEEVCVQVWPGSEPGAGVVGWVVVLHVAKARAGWRWTWRPDPVLIVGDPSMSQLWAGTDITAGDQVAVQVLGPARVTCPSVGPRGIDQHRLLATRAPWAWVARVSWPEGAGLPLVGPGAVDLDRVLGQPAHTAAEAVPA